METFESKRSRRIIRQPKSLRNLHLCGSAVDWITREHQEARFFRVMKPVKSRWYAEELELLVPVAQSKGRPFFAFYDLRTRGGSFGVAAQCGAPVPAGRAAPFGSSIELRSAVPGKPAKMLVDRSACLAHQSLVLVLGASFRHKI